MGNDLEKPDGPNVYEAYGNSVSRMTFPGDLLTFSKYGEYKAGQDKDDLPLGTRLVVHPPTMLIGWVRWEDSRPVDFQMGLLSEGFMPPKRDTLGHLDKSQWETFGDGGVKDPWQLSNQVVMTGLDNGDVVYTFTTSSKTGRSALGEVLKAYGHRIRQHPDGYPVVELLMRSYRHPQFGEQRVPVFKLTSDPSDWVKAKPYVDALSKYMGAGGDQVADDVPAITQAKPTPTRGAAKPAARVAVKASTKTTATKAAATTKTTRRTAKGPVRI